MSCAIQISLRRSPPFVSLRQQLHTAGDTVTPVLETHWVSRFIPGHPGRGSPPIAQFQLSSTQHPSFGVPNRFCGFVAVVLVGFPVACCLVCPLTVTAFHPPVCDSSAAMTEKIFENQVDPAKLKLWDAFLCCNTGLYLDFPECIGCSGISECLCCSHAYCCKMGAPGLATGLAKGSDDICRIGLYCCEYGLKKPRTCCLGNAQVCCQSTQVAIPPVPEVPITCAYCFLACYPKFGCCVSMSEIRKAPASQSM